MKLSSIQIVSLSTNLQNPIGTTLKIPSFEAIATGKIFTFEKSVFISALNFTIVINNERLQYKVIYLSIKIRYLFYHLCILTTFQAKTPLENSFQKRAEKRGKFKKLEG
jgi:hypothetical protein